MEGRQNLQAHHIARARAIPRLKTLMPLLGEVASVAEAEVMAAEDVEEVVMSPVRQVRPVQYRHRDGKKRARAAGLITTGETSERRRWHVVGFHQQDERTFDDT